MRPDGHVVFGLVPRRPGVLRHALGGVRLPPTFSARTVQRSLVGFGLGCLGCLGKKIIQLIEGKKAKQTVNALEESSCSHKNCEILHDPAGCEMWDADAFMTLHNFLLHG